MHSFIIPILQHKDIRTREEDLKKKIPLRVQMLILLQQPEKYKYILEMCT